MSKRVVAYHLARLQDKNPDSRIQTIKELELLADPAALEALQDVFQNDPDKNVRQAAQNAGRIIYLRLQGD